MSRAIYALIALVVINLAITVYGFVNESATRSQVVYVPAAADKSSPPTAAPTVPTVAVKLPDDKILHDMIQMVLKQEIAPYAHQLVAALGTTQKGLPKESAAVKENSPENVQAHARATSIVDSALASGQWTSQDNLKIRATVNKLTAKQHDELLDKIVRAANAQQLHVEGHNFPIF